MTWILRSMEENDGWIPLFDGKSTTGWRNYNGTQIGAAWKVEENSLLFDPSTGEKGGDIITTQQYENFELSLEWKISPCGNSGILFNVVEDPKYHSAWLTGPEMQILDNACHPDAASKKHRAGDLYGLIPCSIETVKKAGDWNHVRILSQDGEYEFWLNGVKVIDFKMHTPEWDAMVRESKFKEYPDFGKAKSGHLALQDHDDKVWFRNIRLRVL